MFLFFIEALVSGNMFYLEYSRRMNERSWFLPTNVRVVDTVFFAFHQEVCAKDHIDRTLARAGDETGSFLHFTIPSDDC